ncbi:3-demethylubiquinone-9 3-O-methyltransferase [Chitinispirillum alkaliphilum]|nr:3-demethylubiquinone-9 3-O-methyltransferase [Chitinispirillum alkaliphilum]
MNNIDKWQGSRGFLQSISNPTFFIRNSIMEKKLPLTGDNALDIGCGLGLYTVELIKRGFLVDAIDVSKHAVEVTRAKIPVHLKNNANISVCPVENFEEKKRYDFIICSEVLEHIENDETAIAKISTLLNPGKNLLISVPFDPKLWSNVDVYSNHYRRYSKESLRSMLENNGLEIKEEFCYGFPLLRLWWSLKARKFQKRKYSSKGYTKNKRGITKLLVSIGNHFLRLTDMFCFTTNFGVGLIVLAQKKENI